MRIRDWSSVVCSSDLHGVEGGEHPGNRAYPGIRIGRQQASMMLRDMKDDRSRLKQDEIAFLIGRDLPARMKREMRWLFHLGEGNKANVIRLANLFEGPANPHASREALPLIRDRKGGA